MINIKMNTANTINYLASMDTNLRKAQVSATNKMALQGLTKARKEIREEYNISLKNLTGRTSRNKAVTYVEETYIEGKPAIITGIGQGLSLGKFKVKQKPTGVEVEVRKGNPKIIKRTFGPKIARLGKGVWTREDPTLTGAYETRSARLPIFRLLGPGAATMLRNRKIVKAVKTFVDQKFKSIMDREIKYFLKIK